LPGQKRWREARKDFVIEILSVAPQNPYRPISIAKLATTVSIIENNDVRVPHDGVDIKEVRVTCDTHCLCSDIATFFSGLSLAAWPNQIGTLDPESCTFSNYLSCELIVEYAGRLAGSCLWPRIDDPRRPIVAALRGCPRERRCVEDAMGPNLGAV
jgi:hypothetical protein